MGAGRFEADETAFRVAANKTGAVRDQVAEVIDTLTRRIASRGTPWGDDQIGDTFYKGSENGYGTVKDRIVEQAENVGGSMGELSDGQLRAADEIKKAEEANRRGFSG